jgi:arylsulfatase A-like enzyme
VTGLSGDALVGWSGAAFEAPPPPGRPNLLFIVVDTLRADHLSTYGYGRDTSPQMTRWLADRGARFDQAYSQAPWTLPSAASYLTSRWPGEVVSGSPASFGVPAEVPTLAERLREAGYVTAGFIGNKTLHTGNGFDRGFETFYTPPTDDSDPMLLHADEINRRALPWLRGHEAAPFLLYLHYIDPHDPYENPETPGGRSAYNPGYQGPITGRFVHGIYAGRIALTDVDADTRQIAALYDSEIHYVDARIGELLASIPSQVLARTLVVLTADHGEELGDHGGWKHGQTLYQEQIHVPLLARWDGRIPPASRFANPVRLLDIVPTLLEAAGVPALPADQGVSLLPALVGTAALPRLPVVAEQLSTGPRRAAALLDGKKLLLFDRREPFVPADALQEHLWRVDLSRLRRVESYDLAGDPGERHDLASTGERSRELQTLIHRRYDRELAGLRVMASDLPAGAILDGTIRFERPPARVSPYFLGEQDSIELDGTVLRVRLAAEALVKGALVEGDLGAVLDVVARLDGPPGASVRVLIGAGGTYAGGRVEPAQLATAEMPLVPGEPALRIWVSERGTTGRHAEEDPETLKRLQALGYIQK